MLHKILHITMAVRQCIVLEQNDIMHKQFWLCRLRAGFTFSCKSVQWYWPLTIVPVGTQWSIINPFELKNVIGFTFRPPWLCCAIFFLDDWICYSSFCIFSWVSNECIYYTATINMQSRNAVP
jgi:hypothetical protein